MEEPVQFIQFLLCMFLFNWNFFASATDIEEINDRPEFKIEGKVFVAAKDKEWTMNSRVLVDGGQYLGFVKTDGTFVVNGVPTGSYIVEIANPNALFEALRVDITSKGKIRARRVNFLQPNLVKMVNYPLEFREKGKPNYFQKREQWRLTDFLFNPMVLTMIVPLLLIMVLPKLMNAADADTQKDPFSEMEFCVMNNKCPKQRLSANTGDSDMCSLSKTSYELRSSSTTTDSSADESLNHDSLFMIAKTSLHFMQIENLDTTTKRQRIAGPSEKLLTLVDYGGQGFEEKNTCDKSTFADNFNFISKNKQRNPSVKATRTYLDVRSCVNSVENTATDQNDARNNSLVNPSESQLSLCCKWKQYSNGNLLSSKNHGDKNDFECKEGASTTYSCSIHFKSLSVDVQASESLQFENLGNSVEVSENQNSNIPLPVSSDEDNQDNNIQNLESKHFLNMGNDVQSSENQNSDNPDPVTSDEGPSNNIGHLEHQSFNTAGSRGENSLNNGSVRNNDISPQGNEIEGITEEGEELQVQGIKSFGHGDELQSISDTDCTLTEADITLTEDDSLLSLDDIFSSEDMSLETFVPHAEDSLPLANAENHNEPTVMQQQNYSQPDSIIGHGASVMNEQEVQTSMSSREMAPEAASEGE